MSDTTLTVLINAVRETAHPLSGELLGLRWQDVNFDAESLHIRRTVNRVGKSGLRESEPKTAKSRRTIMLPHFVVEVLKEHRTDQIEARLKAGAVWQDHDLVFCTAHGSHIDPANLLHTFQKWTGWMTFLEGNSEPFAVRTAVMRGFSLLRGHLKPGGKGRGQNETSYRRDRRFSLERVTGFEPVV